MSHPPDDTATLLEAIIGETQGDDAQLRTLHQAMSDRIGCPVDAFVVGEPVEVIGFMYDGNVRRGITARCRRRDGSEHDVSAGEVSFPAVSEGTLCVGAYRRWLGLPPAPTQEPVREPKRRHKATEGDIDLSKPVELVVLAPKDRASRCRILGSEREITLRSGGVWDMVPGEIITVRSRKQWSYAGHPYLSGDVVGHRLDVAALGLVPLRLLDEWTWDPSEAYWGEEDELEAWAEEIIAHGPRSSFELEHVLPGEDPDDFDNDPILEAIDRHAAGDGWGAQKVLVEVLAADLRCLDAHAHLGSFAFDHDPAEAIRHYEVGVRIGELSLGADFDGLLPWGRIDNRPFLRCLKGFGLCLWRLGRHDEAAAVFTRLLWLNPSDNQGARFLLAQVRSRAAWEHYHG